MKKKKRKQPKNDINIIEERESDEYFYYIAGYLDSGVPFGITWEEAIEQGLVEGQDINAYDEFPFQDKVSEGLKMNINNFEEHISKTILGRGYQYFIGGNIVKTYDQGDNEYIFLVEGNEEYEVYVEIDDKGEILYSECDCPYDPDAVCKHQVAAFYKLSERLNKKVIQFSRKKSAAKGRDINEVVKDLSKEQMAEIIIDITQKDKILKENLITQYSKDDDTKEIEEVKKLKDNIVRKYTAKEGFIEYSEAGYFAQEMAGLLKR